MSVQKIKEIETTIQCESGWDVEARGDGGKSRGLSQIHSGWNPHVTDEMAFDPEYALNFIVDGFKRGDERKWSCWRKYYGI